MSLKARSKKKQMELPALTQKSSAVSFFHPDVRNA
jgi:hypothetical protein